MDELLFEQAFSKFLEEQKRTASGLRLEQLQKDLVGEKKLLKSLVWPVFKSFDGFVLEYEMLTPSGVRIFIDAFYVPLLWGFESEGFAVHAEKITRDRFNFERMRVRTMAAYGYKYLPFTWEELEKKPEACQRYLFELLGRNSGGSGTRLMELPVYEREILRQGVTRTGAFRLKDVCDWLQMSEDFCCKVTRRLVDKKLVRALGKGTTRVHHYECTEEAAAYFVQ